MKVVNIKIEELKPYKNNPRFNEQAVDPLAESIKEFGFKVPIVIDSNKEIITGHTRLLAAKKLGLKEVPCIIADDLSPEQVKAFRIIDNKVAEKADWDLKKLSEEIKDLNYDLTDFGFEDFEIANLTENPFFDEDTFNQLFTECASPEPKEQSSEKTEPFIVKCPHCGKKFDVNSSEETES